MQCPDLSGVLISGGVSGGSQFVVWRHERFKFQCTVVDLSFCAEIVQKITSVALEELV